MFEIKDSQNKKMAENQKKGKKNMPENKVQEETALEKWEQGDLTVLCAPKISPAELKALKEEEARANLEGARSAITSLNQQLLRDDLSNEVRKDYEERLVVIKEAHPDWDKN